MALVSYQKDDPFPPTPSASMRGISHNFSLEIKELITKDISKMVCLGKSKPFLLTVFSNT